VVDSKESKEIEEAKKLVKELQTTNEKTEEANSQQIIADACAHVQSWKTTEFDIRLHPNLFQPVCQLADDTLTLAKDKSLLNDACKHLVTAQLPAMVRDLCDHSIYIIDGATLCETMHARGINVRYLGTLVDLLAKHEHQQQAQQQQQQQQQSQQLSYVHAIALNELVSRCVKRVFRQYVQAVSSLSLSQAVAHFLNCYLSNYVKQLAQSVSPTSAVTNGNLDGDRKEDETVIGKTVAVNAAASTGGGGKKKRRNQKKNNRNILQSNFFVVVKLLQLKIST
jgi:protein TIF31